MSEKRAPFILKHSNKWHTTCSLDELSALREHLAGNKVGNDVKSSHRVLCKKMPPGQNMTEYVAHLWD